MFEWIKNKLTPHEQLQVVKRAQWIEVVQEVAAPYTENWGINQQKPLTWTSQDGPIRKYFQFIETKGCGLALRWGVSIDCVPHRTGSQLAWHRSFQSARPDLFESTMFGLNSHPGGTTIIRLGRISVKGARKKLNDLVQEYYDDITNFFERARSLDALEEIAREQLTAGSQPYNDPCPEYVLAFLLREQGRDDEIPPYFEAFAAKYATLLKGKQRELVAKRLGIIDLLTDHSRMPEPS